MRFALEHRQAVIMRTHAASKHRIAVIQQVMHGNCGGDMRGGVLYLWHRIGRRDVLEANA
jgi:hypothetical protein